MQPEGPVLSNTPVMDLSQGLGTEVSLSGMFLTPHIHIVFSHTTFQLCSNVSFFSFKILCSLLTFPMPRLGFRFFPYSYSLARIYLVLYIIYFSYYSISTVGGKMFLFCLLLYIQCLEMCLAHSRSLSICGMSESVEKISWFMSTGQEEANLRPFKKT